MDAGERVTDRELARLEKRLRGVYEQAYRELSAKASAWAKAHEARAEKYAEQLAAGRITQADYDAWMRGQMFMGRQWEARVNQMSESLYHADVTARQMINDGRYEVYAQNANLIAYQLEQGANAELGFGLYDANTVKRLVMEQPGLLPRPTVKKDRTFRWYNNRVNNAVTQGILQGEDMRQIAKRIASSCAEASMTAAVRNARTAYTGAQNAGRMQGMKDAQALGIKVQKQWVATLDSRTRDAHADLDGQVQDVDDPFDSELGPIDYPGDPSADPANVYNCRCTIKYVYPDYPDEARQRRDNETGEAVGDMTYKEWAESKQANGEMPVQETPVFEIRHADFTPAASIKEAEEYAAQFLGYNGKVSYRGLSIDAANACNQTIADIRENIPGFKLAGIEPMNMRANIWSGTTAEAAYRWGGDGKLYINPTYYKNAKVYEAHVAEIDGLMKTVLSAGQELIDSGSATGKKAEYISALLETKRQCVSQSYDFMHGTFVHEMGHAIDDKLVRREIREQYPGLDGARDFLTQSMAKYGGHISGYAISDNREYIAESFTAWWFGERDKVDPMLSGIFEKVMGG